MTKRISPLLAVLALFVALGCDKKDSNTGSNTPPPGVKGPEGMMPGKGGPGMGGPMQMFAMNCRNCHQLEGVLGGDPNKKPNGPELTKIGSKHNAEKLVEIITKGGGGYGGKMPAFEGKLSAEDIKKLAEFLAEKK